MAFNATQPVCEYCSAKLRRNAAYCEECGRRTRRARRLTRIAIRVEVLAIILTAIVVLGFAYIYER